MQRYLKLELPASLPATIRQGNVAFEAQSTGPVFRVVSGAFRLDCVTDAGKVLTHLALPGDWIGLEALCDSPYACSATALVLSEVEALDVSDLSRLDALSAVICQQQRQMLEMVALRSGTMMARLKRLMALLTGSDRADLVVPNRQKLPRLKQIAQIIDTTVETVCREMARLEPTRPKRKPALKLVVSPDGRRKMAKNPVPQLRKIAA